MTRKRKSDEKVKSKRTPESKMKNTTEKPKSKYDIPTLVAMMEEYIANTEIPIFKEFCYKNDLSYQYIKNLRGKLELKETDPDSEENPLSYVINKLMMKKEVSIERGAMKGTIPTSFAIFSLKQMGWRERQEIEIPSYGDGEGLRITLVKAGK